MEEKNGTIDLHVSDYTPLISPKEVQEKVPRSDRAKETVVQGRGGIESILDRKDQRKIIIVGPCSIDDPEATIEYAKLLKELSSEVSDTFLTVMRTYFEKPRTGPSWEGLIIDPNLDGSNDVNKGYELSVCGTVKLNHPTKIGYAKHKLLR